VRRFDIGDGLQQRIAHALDGKQQTLVVAGGSVDAETEVAIRNAVGDVGGMGRITADGAQDAAVVEDHDHAQEQRDQRQQSGHFIQRAQECSIDIVHVDARWSRIHSHG